MSEIPALADVLEEIKAAAEAWATASNDNDYAMAAYWLGRLTALGQTLTATAVHHHNLQQMNRLTGDELDLFIHALGR